MVSEGLTAPEKADRRREMEGAKLQKHQDLRSEEGRGRWR